ncbi:MAG: glycosyltransferase family 4 protein [Planctomycetes bacterium]|nr:glycosyltransferase family 4 protein [Planctomycetota bacterium]
MRLPIALDYRPALLSRAGIGRVTRELARALAARDDLDVHLFGHSLAPARVAAEVPQAARLHRLPIPGRSLGTLARFGLPAERLAGGARVFHWTDYVQPPVGGAGVVLTVHDLAFVREPAWHGAAAATLRERTRAAIGRADAVIVASATTASDVREFAPDAAARLFVVPFGADHVPADATGAPAPARAEPYALCVGTIEPRKNHRTLLAAWRQLPAPCPKLVVVGAIGWQCDEIVAELAAAERDGLIEWRRDCDDATLWQLLRDAALSVYPSLWEGFGLPPIEAMACGVPVVANDTPALRELVGDAAVLANATDADSLAAAIAATLANRDRLARSARARAAQFRWAECAARHAEIYRDVAGETAR